MMKKKIVKIKQVWGNDYEMKICNELSFFFFFFLGGGGGGEGN